MATASQRVGPIEPTMAPDASHIASEFSVFQDNGGSYRWLLASADGSVLARSGSFIARGEAEQAVESVMEIVRSARLVPARDEGRAVAFTHVGSIDSEAGLA